MDNKTDDAFAQVTPPHVKESFTGSKHPEKTNISILEKASLAAVLSLAVVLHNEVVFAVLLVSSPVLHF